MKFGSIPIGAALFIHKTDGKEPEKFKGDGIGNLSHIGVYTGRTAVEMMDAQLAKMDPSEAAAFKKKVSFGDNAINSSATRGCVATSKFNGKSINGGWNRVGLWNRFYYTDAIERYFNGGGGEPTMGTAATVVLPDGKSGLTVNMRASASKDGELIDRVPVGAAIDVLSQDATWCQIKYNGMTGYMMTEFIRINGNSDSPGDSVTLSAEEVAQIDNALETIGKIIGRG